MAVCPHYSSGASGILPVDVILIGAADGSFDFTVTY